MVVADAKESLTITGNGDVVEPHDGVVGELADFMISPASQGNLVAAACSPVCFVLADDEEISINVCYAAQRCALLAHDVLEAVTLQGCGRDQASSFPRKPQLRLQRLTWHCACVAAIGSGGPYALAAARALIDLPDYDARTIGK